jgi:hypothetical protein
MRRVQPDEAEIALLHAFHHRLGPRIILLLRAAMTPKDEHVRRIERGIAQALIRLVELRRLHGKARQLRQMRRERLTEELFAIALLLLRLLLIPHEHADGLGGEDRAEENTQEQSDEFHEWGWPKPTRPAASVSCAGRQMKACIFSEACDEPPRP